MMRRTFALAALAVASGLLGGPRGATAQPAPGGPAEAVAVRLDARFVDRSSGSEAEWGATGQILLPPAPGDAAVARWRGARALATSSSRQSVTLAPGTTAAIRVGRDVPFSGWFLRRGRRTGLLEESAEWREVESMLEVEVLPPGPDRALHLVLTPEFGYLSGRSRRFAVFADQRAEVVLADGAEARFAAPAGLEEFYSRVLAGYDPLRRVRVVDLLLRATVLRPPPPPGAN
jgi:hypothetical protein